MIKITYKHLLSKQFQSAMSKVASHGEYPSMTVRYNIAKLLELIEKEAATATQLHAKILASAQEKMKGVENEKANCTEEESAKKREEVTKSFQKEVAELLDMSVTFEKRAKLTHEQIASVPLSPLELLSIHECVELPVEEQEKAMEAVAEQQSAQV